MIHRAYPAVCVSASKSPADKRPGSKVILSESTRAPRKFPWHKSSTSCKPARCCGLNPGLLLLARMWWICTGRPNKQLSEAEFRRIWPPYVENRGTNTSISGSPIQTDLWTDRSRAHLLPPLSNHPHQSCYLQP